MVKYSVGRLNYILSLAKTAGDRVGTVLMPSQPEIMKVEYYAVILWLAQSMANYAYICRRLFRCLPQYCLGQGDVHHSTLKAKLQSYPSSLYLLIWDDLFVSYKDVMLPTVCWIQVCAAHVNVSKLCCVTSPRLSAFPSVVLLLSVQARIKKELLTLFPILPYLKKCAGICRPSLHWSKTVSHTAEMVHTRYPNSWLRKTFRQHFRNIHVFVPWQDTGKK